MTEVELSKKVQYGRASGYGFFKVTITYRGKEYHCLSHNTQAIDRIKSDDFPIIDRDDSYPTKKQAYVSLYNECKYKNFLA